MPTTVTAEVRAKFSAIKTGVDDFGGPISRPVIDKLLQFGNGTTANNVDIVWADTRTLTASSNETLDMSGVLTDAFGVVVAPVELVAMLVTADATNVNDVVVGAAAAPVLILGGTTPTFSVKPGGWWGFAAPNAVGQAVITNTTADGIKVANGGAGTSVTYSIFILARTA